MPSNGFSLGLPIGKVSKVKNHHGDAIYSVDELGSFKGSFAIASSKKELKALMTSWSSLARLAVCRLMATATKRAVCGDSAPRKLKRQRQRS